MKHLRFIFIFLQMIFIFSCEKIELEATKPLPESLSRHQRSYSVEKLPFERARLEDIVNRVNIERKTTAKTSSLESLSVGSAVVENRNENNVSYSIELISDKVSDDYFHNLVIEKTPQKEAAFLITYHPTEAYLDAIKRGFADTPFEGSFNAQPLYYYQEGLDNSGHTVVCFTYEVRINCTAGGNHTVDQIKDCKGTKDQLPHWQTRTSCYTFFPRGGGNGPYLSPAPSPKDIAYPISYEGVIGGGGGTPLPKKATHLQPHLTPRFECLNADCSKVRAIDPVEITPIYVASINWLTSYLGQQEMTVLSNDHQFGIDVSNFIRDVLLVNPAGNSTTENAVFKQAIETTKNIIALKKEKSDLLFRECLTLHTAIQNPDPITGASVALYMILKHKDPTFFDISAFSIGSGSVEAGEYTLTPHYATNGRLVFYTAARYKGNKPIHDIEYVVQADALEDFKSKIFYYTSSANIFYLNGIPSESQIALAAGDYMEGLTKMWGEALHSAEWWAYAITTMGQAIVSLPTGATVNSTITTKQWKTSMRDLTSKFFQGKKVINNQGIEVVIRIPDDYVATITNNGKGINFRPLGSTDNTNLIRVMSPGKSGGVFYPKGYVVFYNQYGQAINPTTGKTLSKINHHFEFK